MHSRASLCKIQLWPSIELTLNPETSGEWVQRVEIYANDVLIEQGEVFIPGKYTFTWEDVKAGKYALKAVVIDFVGVKGESSPISIIVKDRGVKNQ